MAPGARDLSFPSADGLWGGTRGAGSEFSVSRRTVRDPSRPEHRIPPDDGMFSPVDPTAAPSRPRTRDAAPRSSPRNTSGHPSQPVTSTRTSRNPHRAPRGRAVWSGVGVEGRGRAWREPEPARADGCPRPLPQTGPRTAPQAPERPQRFLPVRSRVADLLGLPTGRDSCRGGFVQDRGPIGTPDDSVTYGTGEETT